MKIFNFFPIFLAEVSVLKHFPLREGLVMALSLRLMHKMLQGKLLYTALQKVSTYSAHNSQLQCEKLRAMVENRGPKIVKL